MGFGKLVRKLLSTRDERGRITSDRFRMAVRKAVRALTAGAAGRVLDCGGADGLLFDPGTSPLACVTTVLDFDTAALSEGREAYGGAGTFVCGDITGMPFPDSVFDISVCIGTFYNFPSAETVASGIAEMARVTAPGGSIVLEFRNADNPVVSMAYRHAESYDPSLNGLPLNAYTIKDVTSMLEKLGLEVIRIKYIGIPQRMLAIGFVVVAGHLHNGGR